MNWNNEGNTDRIVRLALGLAALAAGLVPAQGLSGNVVGIVIAVVGAVLVVTGLVGFCPAYALFGINTCPAKKHQA